MLPALQKFLPDRQSKHWRGRATRLTLALVIHILAFIIAFMLSPPLSLKKPEPELMTIMLPSPDDKHSKPKTAARPRAVHRSVAARSAATLPPIPPTSPMNMMVVSSDVFHAGDISRIHPSDNPAPSNSEQASEDSDPSVGTGPGGAKLYNAEWYREPTEAELAYYMPKNIRQSGWGEIACKSIPNYRVEDCVELAESPPGIGLARTMREAAWQFRIRPPRIGGKPIMGAWIRIRYDLTVGFKK